MNKKIIGIVIIGAIIMLGGVYASISYARNPQSNQMNEVAALNQRLDNDERVISQAINIIAYRLDHGEIAVPLGFLQKDGSAQMTTTSLVNVLGELQREINASYGNAH